MNLLAYLKVIVDFASCYIDSSPEYQLCKYEGMHEDLTVALPVDGLLMSLDMAPSKLARFCEISRSLSTNPTLG